MSSPARQQAVSAATVGKEDRKAFFLIFAPAFVLFLEIDLVVDDCDEVGEQREEVHRTHLVRGDRRLQR